MEDISLALFDSIIPGTEGTDLLTSATELLTGNSLDSLSGTLSGASALLGSGLLGNDGISDLVTELVIVSAVDGIATTFVSDVVSDTLDPFVDSSIGSLISNVSGEVAGDVAGDVARSIFSPSQDDTDPTSESTFDFLTGLFF